MIPAVESAYKVDSSRDSRAIAGLSMGGAESLFTGLNRLDKFSWVSAFSAGGLGDDLRRQFSSTRAKPPTSNSICCGLPAEPKIA